MADTKYNHLKMFFSCLSGKKWDLSIYSTSNTVDFVSVSIFPRVHPQSSFLLGTAPSFLCCWSSSHHRQELSPCSGYYLSCALGVLFPSISCFSPTLCVVSLTYQHFIFFHFLCLLLFALFLMISNFQVHSCF